MLRQRLCRSRPSWRLRRSSSDGVGHGAGRYNPIQLLRVQYVQRIWTSSYASSIAMQLKFRVRISSWSSPLHAPSDRRSPNDTEPHYKGTSSYMGTENGRGSAEADIAKRDA